MPPVKATYNILSIDGGPAAPVQIRMLRKIEQKYPGFLASIDLFAGTSDGAVIGMFLASRLPKDFEEAKRISLDVLDDAIALSDATIAALQPTPWTMARFALGLGPLIDNAPLQRLLDDAFGNMRMIDIERAGLVVAFDCENWSVANIYKLSSELHFHAERTITEALMASAALPIYAPVFHAPDGHRFLDGVFVANNPSLLAAVLVLQNLTEPHSPLLSTGPLSKSDAMKMLRMVSLGLEETLSTNENKLEAVPSLIQYFLGKGQRPDRPEHIHWGWFDWILNRPTLLPALLHSAQNNTTDFECRVLLEQSNYFRYAPAAPTVAVLGEIATRNAQRVFDAAKQFVENEWENADVDIEIVQGTHGAAMLNWVGKHWFSDENRPPVASATMNHAPIVATNTSPASK